MKKLIFIALILIQTALLLAVFDDYIPSARARGMVELTPVWRTT